MKPYTIVCALLPSLTLSQSLSPGGSSLLSVLQNDPDTQAFGQLLGAHPDLLNNLDPTKNYTVFAPSNAAVDTFQQSFNINSSSLSRRAHGLYRRSISDFVAAIALHFTDRSNQVNLNLESTDLITNLTDPAFINIGPASASASATSSFSLIQPSFSSTLSASSIVPSSTSSPSSTAPSSSSASPPSTSAPVSSSSPSPPGSTVAPTSSPQPQTSGPPAPSSPPNSGNPPARMPTAKQMEKRKRSFPPFSNHLRRQLNQSSFLVFSGLGKESQASLGETLYSNGAVRKVDSFFTLFGDLASTLQQTNGTAFANSLSGAGLLDSLSKTPRITVFVPNDAILAGQVLDAGALQRYVLPNTLATSASLKAGTYKTSAGDSVNVTTNADGTFSVNNATIVKSNVMIKNGVVHYINNVYTDTLRGSASGLTFSMLSVVASVAISCLSLL